MKPQITDQLILEIIEIIRSTKNLVMSESPDIVRQIYAWSIWSNKVALGGGFTLLLLSAWIWYMFCKTDSGEDIFPVIIIMGIITGVLGILFTIGSSCDLYKIKIAPKLFLIDYLTNMAKDK